MANLELRIQQCYRLIMQPSKKSWICDVKLKPELRLANKNSVSILLSIKSVLWLLVHWVKETKCSQPQKYPHRQRFSAKSRYLTSDHFNNINCAKGISAVHKGNVLFAFREQPFL